MPPSSLHPHLHSCEAILEELPANAVQSMEEGVVEVGQLLAGHALLCRMEHGSCSSILPAQRLVGLHMGTECEDVPPALDVSVDDEASVAGGLCRQLQAFEKVVCAGEVHGHAVAEDHVVLLLAADVKDLMCRQGLGVHVEMLVLRQRLLQLLNRLQGPRGDIRANVEARAAQQRSQAEEEHTVAAAQLGDGGSSASFLQEVPVGGDLFTTPFHPLPDNRLDMGSPGVGVGVAAPIQCGILDRDAVVGLLVHLVVHSAPVVHVQDLVATLLVLLRLPICCGHHVGG
mmetsp:Transcript_49844/g.116281  ORF Transcript_49844/g.116281 Transcript_49844/m.116281 type:complete len:286 (+) Transcript_49844:2225-3082(+)